MDRKIFNQITPEVAMAATREFNSPREIAKSGIQINPDIIGMRWGEKAKMDHIGHQAAQFKARNAVDPGVFRGSIVRPMAAGITR